MNTWDMREAMKTYARSPVHSLCALCPSPPKDQLTKTADLDTQRANQAKSILGICATLQKHMREGQFTACSTCALALHLLDTVIYKQKSVLQFLPSAVNYDRKSIFWCAASRQVL